METGYSITTWRMTLRCRHPEWLKDTEAIYRKICLFYYQVIREQNLLEHGGSMQQLQREAERLTIKGRNGTRRCISFLLRTFRHISADQLSIKLWRRQKASAPEMIPEKWKRWMPL